MLERLKKSEELFAENNYYGMVSRENIFEFTDRSSKVILSAPHAVRSFVQGGIKVPDLFTGAIAEVLGCDCALSTIVRTRYAEGRHYISDFVKEKGLKEHYFLDIHGMSENQNFELAVGTGYFSAQSYSKILIRLKYLAEKYGIKMTINHPDYRGAVGLTGRYQKEYGSPNILQLEWRKDMRDFYRFPEKVLNITLPFIKEAADCQAW